MPPHNIMNSFEEPQFTDLEVVDNAYSDRDYEINVSHIVYETIFLGLPIRKFHDQETNGQICDEEVIKRLREYQKKEASKGVDDRWSALKKLLTDKD